MTSTGRHAKKIGRKNNYGNEDQPYGHENARCNGDQWYPRTSIPEKTRGDRRKKEEKRQRETTRKFRAQQAAVKDSKDLPDRQRSEGVATAPTIQASDARRGHTVKLESN